MEVDERLYMKTKPDVDEVRRVAALLPGGVKDLVSRKGRVYRQMGLVDRSLTDEEWVELLAREPGLWRRPVIIRGSEAIIGYDQAAIVNLIS